MTVKEVSRITGISVRTLQHYDNIGLLRPAGRTESGYRIYNEDTLRRLQDILLLRELEFSLKEIKEILDSPHYDRARAISDQIVLLEYKRQRLDAIISLARGIQSLEDTAVNLKPFDRREQEKLNQEAKQKWSAAPAWQEYEDRSKGRSRESLDARDQGLMLLFAEFGAMKDQAPSSEAAQAQAKKLQAYISQHYYTCTPQILATLGQMYIGDDRFRANIDSVGGEGTAQFASLAIADYCG